MTGSIRAMRFPADVVLFAVMALAVAIFASVVLPPVSSAFADVFDRVAGDGQPPWRVAGAGFVTDESHPAHPDDLRNIPIRVTIAFDPEPGEAVIEVDSGEEGKPYIDRYFVRRGRVFQVSKEGAEIAPEALGDLSPTLVAALHPALVANAVAMRREALREYGDGNYLFAWGDDLWDLGLTSGGDALAGLGRRLHHERRGDGGEEVRYGRTGADSLRTVVRSRGRELAAVAFGPPSAVDSAGGASAGLVVPAGDPARDRERRIAAREIVFRELAPHLFAVDLASIDTRVMVVEFADELAILEGAYNSANCDLLARAVRARFGKPVRWFAFSHIHGQYIGGVRSWVHEGATVLAPPTTVPLVESMATARYDLLPDALARDPKPPRVEAVPKRRVIEDATNVLEIHNIESGHTDEYFIFYLPRQKVLLTGDLLFYRPGQSLTGRSKKLCQTIKALGLDVETCVATWPLDGYGTKNIVSREELEAGCGE